MTTATDFAADLRADLMARGLPAADIDDAVEFYESAIADRVESGMSEAEAVASLGSPKDIAADVPAFEPPLARKMVQMSPAALALIVVLLIFSSPVWISLLSVPVALILTLIVTVVGVDLGFLIAFPSMVIVAIAAAVQGEMSVTVAAMLGASAVLTGLAIVFLPLAERLVELLVRLVWLFIVWVAHFFTPIRQWTYRKAWYGTAFRVRRADRIAGIIGLVVTLMGAVAFLICFAMVGFDLSNFPPTGEFTLFGQEVGIAWNAVESAS